MITLRTYWNPVEADLAKSLLEAQDIFCILTDENVNSYGGAPSAMPIRLQVEEERAEEAQQILNAEPVPLPDDLPFLESSSPLMAMQTRSKGTNLSTAIRKSHAATELQMTPRNCFILIIRAFGVWEAIYTVDSAVTIFNIHAQMYRLERTQPEAYVTHGLASLLLAGWFLTAAPSIARFFYPDPPEKPEADLPTAKDAPDANKDV